MGIRSSFGAALIGCVLATCAANAAELRAERVRESAQSPAVVIDASSLVDLAVHGDSGSVLLPLSGQAALGKASFTTTTLTPEQRSVIHLGADPTPSALYTFPGSGKQFLLLPQSQISGIDFVTYSRLFVVEAESPDAPALALYAGIDSDNDGKPSAGEQRCATSTTSGAKLRCIVDLHGVTADPKNVWALIDVPGGVVSSRYTITVSAAVPSVGYVLPAGTHHTLLATGPGHVAAGAPFDLRLAWDSANQVIEPGTRYYAALLLDAVSGRPPQQLGRDGLIPIAFTRSAGGDDVIDALAPTFARSVVLSAGETAQRRFLDVTGSGTLDLHSGCPDTLCASKLDLAVVRGDFPAPGASPDIPPAPPTAAQWSFDTLTTREQRTIAVTPGRWFIVVHNSGNQAAAVNLSGALLTTGATAAPAPGSYYNPARAGHGIFLSRAGALQALYWYTYLEDGTPVWYAAQANAPEGAATTWAAQLFRVNWDGIQVNGYDVVGDVVLTPVGTNEFIYSWHVNGAGGSEHFVQLAPSSCLSFQGAAADFTGQWYAPAQSGYGMDVLALASQQFDAFYFYDGLGQPRWAAGSSAGFSANTTLSMNQLAGFCPSCAAVATTPTPIGTLNVNYTDATRGSYSTSLSLAAPLAGNWNVNQPIVRLTGSPACTP